MIKKFYGLFDCTIKEVVLCFFSILLCCIFSLIIVAILPNQRIKDNIKVSSNDLLNREWPYYIGEESFDNYLNIAVDSVVLNFIYNQDNDKPIESALIYRQMCPKFSDQKKDYYSFTNEQIAMLYEYVNSDNCDITVGVYPAYWLGEIVFIRSLLVLFEYKKIEIILHAISLVLLMISMSFLAKKELKAAISFGMAMASINFYVLSFNLFEGISCILVAIIAIIVLTISQKEKSRLVMLMIVGMLTAYFDYFSIPLVSYGLVTIVILSLCDSNYRECFKILLNCSMGWIIGYGGMITIKPVISYFILGTDAFRLWAERVKMETVGNVMVGPLNEEFLKLLGYLRPFVWANSFNWKIVAILLFFGVVGIITHSYVITNKKIAKYISIIVIGLSPFVWFFVFKTHIHHGFDYRALATSVFAYFYIILDVYSDLFLFTYNKLAER